MTPEKFRRVAPGAYDVFDRESGVALGRVGQNRDGSWWVQRPDGEIVNDGYPGSRATAGRILRIG